MKMKKIGLVVAVVIMMFVSVPVAYSGAKPKYTIEPDAQIFGAVKGRMDIVDALVKFVKTHGNRCDSVSAAYDNMFSKGFTLKCNKSNYSYEILDKGGKWYLQVNH
jgi:hypothetical protein